MKTLFETINAVFEARMMSLLDIPFEDFKQFAEDWILSDDPTGWNDKSGKKLQSYNTLERALKNKTPDCDTVIHALYIYLLKIFDDLEACNANINTDDVLHTIYNEIAKMPISKIENGFSMGLEGMVIDLGNKVIKCFFSNKIPVSKKRFYQICKERKYDVFPYVYRIGNGYVVMEKLTMYTQKCHKYQKIIDKVYDAVSNKRYDITKYSKDEQEVILWMEKIRTAIKDATIFDDLGDLDEKNFGERSDGTIVYFDV